MDLNRYGGGSAVGSNSDPGSSGSRMNYPPTPGQGQAMQALPNNSEEQVRLMYLNQMFGESIASSSETQVEFSDEFMSLFGDSISASGSTTLELRLPHKPTSTSTPTSKQRSRIQKMTP